MCLGNPERSWPGIESVSGERLRILLLGRTAPETGAVRFESSRAQALSVAERSLANLSKYENARKEFALGKQSSVSGEVHGNFAACL